MKDEQLFAVGDLGSDGGHVGARDVELIQVFDVAKLAYDLACEGVARQSWSASGAYRLWRAVNLEVAKPLGYAARDFVVVKTHIVELC